MMKIDRLIGDYQAFFADLLDRMKVINIDIRGMALSHFLYRTMTVSEYESLRDDLKAFCRAFVETQFKGRAISVLVLQEPLSLADGFQVSTIELPAPKVGHVEVGGLESIGVIVGKALPDFIDQHKTVLTGIKNRSENKPIGFIHFDHGKESKFYDISLEAIVASQGWSIEPL